MVQVFLVVGSSSPWSVPANLTVDGTWFVELVGAGGDGAVGTTGTSGRAGGGGGSGGYGKFTYSSGTVTPEVTTIPFRVGIGGDSTGHYTQWQSSGDPGTNCHRSECGGDAVTTTGGAGGASGAPTGSPPISFTTTINRAGAAGGTGQTAAVGGGAGGGGAAGPTAAGGTGGTPSGGTTNGMGGGGGNNGATGNAPGATSLNGGQGSSGAPGTVQSAAGTGNSGGAGDTMSATPLIGGNGGSGTDFDGTHGCGGGGGGSAANTTNSTVASTGGNGGNYGGGGGGCGSARGPSSTFNAGQGADGLIVITYTAGIAIYQRSYKFLFDDVTKFSRIQSRLFRVLTGSDQVIQAIKGQFRTFRAPLGFTTAFSRIKGFPSRTGTYYIGQKVAQLGLLYKKLNYTITNTFDQIVSVVAQYVEFSGVFFNKVFTTSIGQIVTYAKAFIPSPVNIRSFTISIGLRMPFQGLLTKIVDWKATFSISQVVTFFKAIAANAIFNRTYTFAIGQIVTVRDITGKIIRVPINLTISLIKQINKLVGRVSTALLFPFQGVVTKTVQMYGSIYIGQLVTFFKVTGINVFNRTFTVAIGQIVRLSDVTNKYFRVSIAQTISIIKRIDLDLNVSITQTIKLFKNISKRFTNSFGQLVTFFKAVGINAYNRAFTVAIGQIVLLRDTTGKIFNISINQLVSSSKSTLLDIIVPIGQTIQTFKSVGKTAFRFTIGQIVLLRNTMNKTISVIISQTVKLIENISKRLVVPIGQFVTMFQGRAFFRTATNVIGSTVRLISIRLTNRGFIIPIGQTIRTIKQIGLNLIVPPITQVVSTIKSFSLAATRVTIPIGQLVRMFQGRAFFRTATFAIGQIVAMTRRFPAARAFIVSIGQQITYRLRIQKTFNITKSLIVSLYKQINKFATMPIGQLATIFKAVGINAFNRTFTVTIGTIVSVRKLLAKQINITLPLVINYFVSIGRSFRIIFNSTVRFGKSSVLRPFAILINQTISFRRSIVKTIVIAIDQLIKGLKGFAMSRRIAIGHFVVFASGRTRSFRVRMGNIASILFAYGARSFDYRVRIGLVTRFSYVSDIISQLLKTIVVKPLYFANDVINVVRNKIDPNKINVKPQLATTNDIIINKIKE